MAYKSSLAPEVLKKRVDYIQKLAKTGEYSFTDLRREFIKKFKVQPGEEFLKYATKGIKLPSGYKTAQAEIDKAIGIVTRS